MSDHEFSNELSLAENERLAFLMEEMGEALQIIGKIQRHGYESHDPTTGREGPTNRLMLEKELGDVVTAMELMTKGKDISRSSVRKRIPHKLGKLARYTHHNHELIDALLDELLEESSPEDAR